MKESTGRETPPARNITEEALRESEERLKLALDAVEEGIWDWDLPSARVYFSPRWFTMVGYPDQAFPPNYETWAKLVHPDDIARAIERIGEHNQGNTPGYECEFRIRTADGGWRWVLAKGRVVKRDAAGKPIRMIGTHRDISAQRAAEEELRLAKESAEAASRVKSDFLANMSHEIRTPMTAILGYLELLERGEESELERAEFTKVIRRNAEHLISIINDILDMSRIEAGKLSVELVPCSPIQIVNDAASLLQRRAASKGLSFIVDSSGDAPVHAYCDPTRLRQILINLVGNAIKFTDRGGVRISIVTASGTDPDSCVIQISVSDTGPGIEESVRARLFEPFITGGGASARAPGGSGLGLAISRRLAELLGGSLELKSSENEGSKFVLTLPLRLSIATSQMQLPPSSTDAPTDMLSGNILLVEDGLDNQRLLRLYLERIGLNVTTASNGREAIELYSRQPTGSPVFDVILIDMQMPVLNGYEATRSLRAMGATLPIIALTAYAMDADRQKCLQAGCSEYLAKPIDQARLWQTLQRYLPRSDAPPRKLAAIQSSRESDPALTTIIVQFTAELPSIVRELKSASKQTDAAALSRAAHRLRGTSAAFGFIELDLAARECQRLISERSARQDLEAAADLLINAIRRVKGYPNNDPTDRD